MAIDPNISLGVRPIELANPLAQYGQIAQIQQAQQANQLNALKMQEAQATMEERNALRRLDPTAADYESQLFRVNPQLGINYRKEAATTAAQKAAETKSLTETAGLKQKMLSQALRDISYRPSDANITAHTEDIQTSSLFSQEEKAKALITQQTLLAIPFEQRQSYLSQQGATASELRPVSVAPGASLVGRDNKAVFTAPFAPEKPPAPTNLAKLQNELAALQPGDPRIPQYNALIRKETTHAPGTSVTMVAEKAEAGAFGKMMVDQFADLSKSANLAVKSLPSIEANLNILNKGLDTGFGTETKAAGARVLSALGVKDAEKYATDTQTFQSNAIQGLLQKQLEQKGPQTESDAQRLEQIGAQLGKTKKANEFILDTAREQLKRDIEQRNFYAKWKEKTDSFKGAEDAWFNGEGGKSLFDRPALKKYLTPTVGAVSQIPTTAAPVRSTPVAPNIDALLNKYK
jgi:hypothetical protein